MITQQMLDYIKAQQQAGKSKEQITQELTGNGWKAEDVEQGFVSINSGVPIPGGTELPKAREIYKESWTIYKNRFKTLVGITLSPLVGYLILALGIFAAAAISALLKNNSSGIMALGIAEIVLGLLAIVGLIYLYIWAAVAELFAIKDQAENIGWKEAFVRSRGKINAFFSTGLLSGLAVLGGFILLIIPGIIFGLWFSQYPYMVVEENLTDTAALKRSKYYVKGRIGSVFGKFFYMGIITLGLYIVLAIILNIISSVLQINNKDISWISNIFSVIWTPMVTVFGYQLYKHLKATRP